MKKVIALLVLMTLICTGVYSQRRVPAYRGVIERVMPTSDTLHIYLRGDEWSHFSMTIDGWQVIEDDKGVFYYATLKKGEVVASKRVAHDADQRRWCERWWLKRKGIKKTTEQPE